MNIRTQIARNVIKSSHVIRIPISSDKYDTIIKDATKFRIYLSEIIKLYPELFPPKITDGFRFKEIIESKKIKIYIRKIKIATSTYTIHPSFVMPYLTAKTHDVDKILMLRKFEVPFWALAYIFGRDSAYWYRIEQNIGRFSLVGTTVRDREKLPKNISADEKHTRIAKKKTYVAMTVAQNCILGSSVSVSAGEDDLTKAYGRFKKEARLADPEYEPETVLTDGWKATRKSWKKLFPFSVLILCFLHVYLKIRDKSKKKFKKTYKIVAEKLWDCYKAENKASFSQRARRFYEWAVKEKIAFVFLKRIEKFYENKTKYSVAYDFPSAHRTSNMLDRLMQRMNRHLYNTQYFHGSLNSAELGIRAWSLIINFAPSNPYTIKKHGNKYKSPAERLNQFSYHENWLENLLISASLGGYKSAPPNP